MSKRIYSAVMVKDEQGNVHDIDLYTASYDWGVRLRAVRRWCESHGVRALWAYIGGNMWSRHDIANA